MRDLRRALLLEHRRPELAVGSPVGVSALYTGGRAVRRSWISASSRSPSGAGGTARPPALTFHPTGRRVSDGTSTPFSASTVTSSMVRLCGLVDGENLDIGDQGEISYDCSAKG